MERSEQGVGSSEGPAGRPAPPVSPDHPDHPHHPATPDSLVHPEPPGPTPSGASGLLLDLAYLGAATFGAPVWVTRMACKRRLRTDWPGRLGFIEALPRPGCRPRLLLHAVSNGELHAVRVLVDELAQRDVDVVVSSTTDTGIKRAHELFGSRHPVVRFPLDFSSSVRRALDAVQPDVVALVELEVWPNFIAACVRRSIPVAVVNGRLSERSARRYGWIAPLARRVFSRLSWAAVQDRTYADRFMALGVPPERVSITGTMKWDAAQCEDHVPGSEALARDLARDLGIDPQRPLVVAGSTAPEEHLLLRDAVPPEVQLLIAPRRKEWFDAAAALFPGCVRRSRGGAAGVAGSTGRFILDSMGELREAYALADVVVVGRTFVPMGGSDMIEPIGLGKATIVGPHVENFRDSMESLEAGGGVVRATRETLGATVQALLEDPLRRQALATAGRAVIRSRQGASRRTADGLCAMLGAANVSRLRPTHAAETDRQGGR